MYDVEFAVDLELEACSVYTERWKYQQKRINRKKTTPKDARCAATTFNLNITTSRLMICRIRNI